MDEIQERIDKLKQMKPSKIGHMLREQKRQRRKIKKLKKDFDYDRWVNSQILDNMLQAIGNLNDEVDRIKEKVNLEKSKKTKFSD